MINKRTVYSYRLMLIPGVVFLIIFHIIPMFGVVIAFQKFIPGVPFWKQQWDGWQNFTFMLQIPSSQQVLFNTIFIAVLKLLATFLASVTIALLLNELRLQRFKRWVQTIVYLPHFISWVILSGILLDMLSLNGVVNQLVTLTGHKPILFMASNTWFRPIVVMSNVWKEFGFGAIVYLAALTGINPMLYEAAEIDGAGRWKKLIHVTLPGIVPTIVLMLTLDIGHVMDAGFDQIFNLYNPLVYQTGDIIDTYVYRVGLVHMDFGLATAIGLMKSVVSIVLIVISYRLAYRFANYRIF